jgi:hypothetical protein
MLRLVPVTKHSSEAPFVLLLAEREHSKLAELGSLWLGDIVSVDDVPIREMPIGEVAVGDVPVRDVSIGEVAVGNVPVRDVSVGYMLVGNMLLVNDMRRLVHSLGVGARSRKEDSRTLGIHGLPEWRKAAVRGIRMRQDFHGMIQVPVGWSSPGFSLRIVCVARRLRYRRR